MFDEHVIQVSPVCKHNQQGYCKFGSHCQMFHNNNVCKEIVCTDRNCTKRHPRSCKYLNLYGRCRFPSCAYAHIKSNIQSEIEKLEKEVKDLKHEMAELRYTVSGILARLVTLEVNRETGKPMSEEFLYKFNQDNTSRNNINTEHPTNGVEK